MLASFLITDWQTDTIRDWPTADHVRHFVATSFSLLQQLCTVGHGIFYMADMNIFVSELKVFKTFKARLDKFWQQQLVNFDFTADLTGTGNRSEEAMKWYCSFMIVYNDDADLEVSDTCVHNSLLSWVKLTKKLNHHILSILRKLHKRGKYTTTDLNVSCLPSCEARHKCAVSNRN